MKGVAPPEGLRFGGEWPWWTGPPVNEMPAAIPSGWTLFSTPEVSVFLTEPDVYSTGVQFGLLAFAPKGHAPVDPAVVEAVREAMESDDNGGGSGIRFVHVTGRRPAERMPELSMVFSDDRVAGEADFRERDAAAPRPPCHTGLVAWASALAVAAVSVPAPTARPDGGSLLVAVARRRGRNLRDRRGRLSRGASGHRAPPVTPSFLPLPAPEPLLDALPWRDPPSGRARRSRPVPADPGPDTGRRAGRQARTRLLDRVRVRSGLSHAEQRAQVPLGEAGVAQHVGGRRPGHLA